MHKNDVLALLSTLVGVCALAADASFDTQITHLFPHGGTQAIAILGIVGLVASQVLRVLGAPTQPSSPSLPAALK